MRQACQRYLALCVLVPLVLCASAASAITLGQLDDFEDGTTEGWSEGLFSPNPPINMSTGGPEGAGDNYLSNTSSGEFLTAGGRMLMFNTTTWTGNFVAAGVTMVHLRLANFGTTPLAVRVAFEGAVSQMASTTAFALPPDGVWYVATFGLGPADLTVVGGVATTTAILSDVTMMRILSRAGGPGWQGDEIAGTLGVDRIEAAAASGVGDPPAPTAARLLAAPNPFTGSTLIQFTLDRSGPLRVDVFDLSGRRVRTLRNSAVAGAGRHSVAWDGRNDQGVRLPAGSYFIRLRGSGVDGSRKVLLSH